MRQVDPPHRIRKILEGESLLNDASALLLYKLAVGAVAAGSFSVTEAVPTFAVVVFGSAALGWALAWPVRTLIGRIEDAPTSVILQFVTTFGIWLLAEHLGLSAVVTIVVYGLTIARTGSPMPARLRVPSFAIWESVTFVLNVLAFTLIGLQLGPILEALDDAERLRALCAALAILAIVIAVRLVWVMVVLLSRDVDEPRSWVFAVARSSMSPPTAKGALVVAWSGMRGIVTLAAALALPAGFPHRDFILLTAFVVVFGTLVIQGLTLRPLLVLLRLPGDGTVEAEIRLARKAALKAALAELEQRRHAGRAAPQAGVRGGAGPCLARPGPGRDAGQRAAAASAEQVPPRHRRSSQHRRHRRRRLSPRRRRARLARAERAAGAAALTFLPEGAGHPLRTGRSDASRVAPVRRPEPVSAEAEAGAAWTVGR